MRWLRAPSVAAAVVFVLSFPSPASADWTTPTNLSNSGAASQSPRIVVDGSSNVHVVWEEGDGGGRDLYHAWRPSAGIWSSPTNVSNSSGDATDAALAVRDGTLHAIWQAAPSGGIRYASMTPPSAWTAPLTVTSDAAATSPRLAVDASGTVHVVWSALANGSYDVFHASRPAGGAFGAPTNLSSNAGASEYPMVVADPLTNAVHVVWQDYTPGNCDVYYARRSAGDAWSTPANVSASGGDSSYPLAAVAGDGTLHVVWEECGGGNCDVWHTVRLANGSWLTPTNVSANLWESRQPQLAADADGGLHVIWRDDSPGNGDVFYRHRNAAGAWSAAVNLSSSGGDSAEPQVAVAAGGVVHVVWQDVVSGNLDVMHARRSAYGDWSAPTNVSRSGGASIGPQLASDGAAVHVVWQEAMAGGSEIMYAALVPTATVVGQVRLQGRASHHGAVVSAGGYSTTTDASGVFTLTVAAGTYTITAAMAGYLPAVRNGLVMTDGVVSLLAVTLRGGDADHDGDIDIYDLTALGADFGASGIVAADITGDGVVNVFDLVLVGANFGRAAPTAW